MDMDNIGKQIRVDTVGQEDISAQIRFDEELVYSKISLSKNTVRFS